MIFLCHQSFQQLSDYHREYSTQYEGHTHLPSGEIFTCFCEIYTADCDCTHIYIHLQDIVYFRKELSVYQIIICKCHEMYYHICHELHQK